jgi:hypothetical protein
MSSVPQIARPPLSLRATVVHGASLSGSANQSSSLGAERAIDCPRRRRRSLRMEGVFHGEVDD